MLADYEEAELALKRVGGLQDTPSKVASDLRALLSRKKREARAKEKKAFGGFLKSTGKRQGPLKAPAAVASTPSPAAGLTRRRKLGKDEKKVPADDLPTPVSSAEKPAEGGNWSLLAAAAFALFMILLVGLLNSSYGESLWGGNSDTSSAQSFAEDNIAPMT